MGKSEGSKSRSSFFFLIVVLLFFWPHHTACRILAPWPGIEPESPALDEQIPKIGPPGKSPDGHLTSCRAPILNTLEAFCGKLFLPLPSSCFTRAPLSGHWELLGAWPGALSSLSRTLRPWLPSAVAFLSWEHFSGHLICFLFAISNVSVMEGGVEGGNPSSNAGGKSWGPAPPFLWIPSRPHFLMSDPHGLKSRFPSCRSHKIAFQWVSASALRNGDSLRPFGL